MFIRKGQGIYEFGSSRVMMKLEKDKIMIKIGGSFLKIDQFLDKYTPIELERKIERKDSQ